MAEEEFGRESTHARKGLVEGDEMIDERKKSYCYGIGGLRYSRRIGMDFKVPIALGPVYLLWVFFKAEDCVFVRLCQKMYISFSLP